ncbi:hypothetical protein E3N88_13091 [Mikania micrantha]|uniref:Phloem protein 2-like protein n=1 Tax=Mikania micrantha TaxID=192012 RepID=A0A5N6P969_9ASTR|nr:hypothetical protein E3N88_13091 [Mikania micrantha]
MAIKKPQSVGLFIASSKVIADVGGELAMEVYKNLAQKADVEEMIKIAHQAVTPLSYGSHEQLFMLLLKGIFVDDGTTWLSINNNGGICEMVSATKCVSWGVRDVAIDSRFSNIMMCIYNGFKVKVFTRFLSPHVTYTINIILKINFQNSEVRRAIGTYVSCTYKLDDDSHYLYSSNANMREDGWLVIPLYQFTSKQKTHHFSITIFPLLLNWHSTHCSIESIEFRPVENPTSNSRTQKLPADYKDLINWATYTIQWTSKKELYSILRKGFLIDNGDKVSSHTHWLSISKSMKKRFMIPAAEFLLERKWIWKSLPESRFEMVAESPNIDEFQSLIEGPIALFNQNLHIPRSIYLIAPRIPIIEDQLSSKELTHKIKGHPKVRKDGWMEVQLWEDTTDSIGTIGTELTLNGMDIDSEYNFVGLVVQGIEFRPL